MGSLLSRASLAITIVVALAQVARGVEFNKIVTLRDGRHVLHRIEHAGRRLGVHDGHHIGADPRDSLDYSRLLRRQQLSGGDQRRRYARKAADHVGVEQQIAVELEERSAAHRLLGPGLRADAQLSLRPWIKTAVQIEVDAANDTTPYWVVATRRPSELVGALEFVRYAKAEL